MRFAASLRDRDHANLVREPGKRDLRRRRVMALGYLAQHSMREDAALLDRRISHDWNVTLAAPWHQVEFDAAPAEIVQHLVGGARIAPARLRDLLHFAEIEIAHAPGQNFSGLRQRSEGLQRLAERR